MKKILSLILSIYKVYKLSDFKFNIIRLILKPIIAAAAGGLTAKCMLNYIVPSRLVYIMTAGFMLIMYIVFLFAMGVVSINDIKRLRR